MCYFKLTPKPFQSGPNNEIGTMRDNDNTFIVPISFMAFISHNRTKSAVHTAQMLQGPKSIANRVYRR